MIAFAFFYIEIEKEGKNKKLKNKQIFPFFAGNGKLTSRTKGKVEGEKKAKKLFPTKYSSESYS